MVDHLHLVVPVEHPRAARQRVNRLLGRLAARLGQRVRFEGAAEPAPIADLGKLRRNLRYVALNPPRAGLTDDPLAWAYSTHRDILGATVSPWVTADRLAAALGERRSKFERRYHAYVSADPSTNVAGTPHPRPAEPTEFATYPLDAIAQAAAAASRATTAAIRQRSPARRLFVQLARDQGWRNTGLLARICGCTPRAIQRIAADARPDLLVPARLCLGDPRLRTNKFAEREEMPLEARLQGVSLRSAKLIPGPRTSLWAKLWRRM